MWSSGHFTLFVFYRSYFISNSASRAISARPSSSQTLQLSRNREQAAEEASKSSGKAFGDRVKGPVCKASLAMLCCATALV